MAERMGFKSGSSMDLKTGWDFSRKSHRQCAIETIQREKPWLIIGSPPCTTFSVIQNLNLHKFKDDENWMSAFNERKKKAIEHMSFCMQLYQMQIQSGRYFLHEHPQGATSWDLEMVKEIESMGGVYKVSCDQCQYGLETSVKGESRPARKPTAFMSNSWFVTNELTRKCDGSHAHFSLMEGRAKKAEQYPDGLCKAVCVGMQKQQAYDKTGLCALYSISTKEREKSMIAAGMPPHWRDEQHEDQLEEQILQREIHLLRVKDGEVWAKDDISGVALDPVEVQKARALEMDYFNKMQVYTRVDRSCARGRKLIRTKWIDLNKGDTQSPNYRSRLVAMEFNEYVDPSLFAATPPLEAMRYIISRAATVAGGKKRAVMSVDVSRADFNAECTRDVYIEIPQEDRRPGDEAKVGKLRLCLYGTRDAAHNWGKTVAKQLVQCGDVRGHAFPSVYFNHEDDIAVMVHGDDYGPPKSLEKLRGQLAKSFEIKSSMIGEGPNMDKEGKILNRIIRVTKDGWELEADLRHAELII